MKNISVICLLLMLSACTAFKLAPAGKVSIGDAYTIDLSEPWSLSEFGHLRTYTKDGPVLGAIHVSAGVKEDEHLLTGPEGEKQPPYKKDLSLIELQQFITDSFVAIGAERLTVTEIYPEPFGDWQGVRAEFDFYTKDGLKKRGLLVGAQHNDKFYYVLYEAPAMYFFDKRKSEVDAIIRSIKTTPKA